MDVKVIGSSFTWIEFKSDQNG